MKQVIDLLSEKKESLERSIRFLNEELYSSKKSLAELQSKEFIERNKDNPCWSETWTIHDYIRVNVESRERSIDTYSRKLDEDSEYLSQINKAIEILKGA